VHAWIINLDFFFFFQIYYFLFLLDFHSLIGRNLIKLTVKGTFLWRERPTRPRFCATVMIQNRFPQCKIQHGSRAFKQTFL
jgi:hypothetical protein